MFCKRRHIKNSTCFGHHSMTIFRGRPSFLVHLLLFICLLRHLSFWGLWPYALYLYVCPVYLSVCCLSQNDVTSSLSLSSSLCSWRIRNVSCFMILKMKLVSPSLPRSSYVPSSFWFIMSHVQNNLTMSSEKQQAKKQPSSPSATLTTR
jgi:hypothetical protein